MARLTRQRLLQLFSSGLLSTFLSTTARAANIGGTTSLPFGSAMTNIQNAISGPFLLSAAIIMVVVTCLMLAFGEWGDGFKRIINIVLWISIAFGASAFISNVLGGSGAVI